MRTLKRLFNHLINQSNPKKRRRYTNKFNLRGLDFQKVYWEKDSSEPPCFINEDFSNSDLFSASLRNCVFVNCSFDKSDMIYTDLVDAYFERCTFKRTSIRLSKIGNAVFSNCFFEKADLSYCSAEETSFENSTILNTKLEHMSLVSSNLSHTKIYNCYVYGISSWDLNLNCSVQKDLIITPKGKPTITVDNIELAQFLYLLINNSKLREAIDSISSKAVLILGNFSKERKKILDQIRKQLRNRNLIPILFDFEKPNSRDLTETIRLLALMSKFVIVDLSSPRSSPHEIANIVTDNPSINIFPIVLSGEQPYGMFEDHYKAYPWVKKIKEYTNDNILQVVDEILYDIETP